MKENKTTVNELIETLTRLEYAIRQSITVREDQEDNADPHHVEEAKKYHINTTDDMTKGDLLNAVQTHLRTLQAKTRNTANHS